MFVAGIKHIDRQRGSGWLDCPNCGEHALQDVIDDMAFLQVWFYRLTPLGRLRVLICRRCGYRRPNPPQQLKLLIAAQVATVIGVLVNCLVAFALIGALMTLTATGVFLASLVQLLAAIKLSDGGRGSRWLLAASTVASGAMVGYALANDVAAGTGWVAIGLGVVVVVLAAVAPSPTSHPDSTLVSGAPPSSPPPSLIARWRGKGDGQPSVWGVPRSLNTAGTRIGRAWMAPIGLMSAVLLWLFIIVFVAGSRDVLAEHAIHFRADTGHKTAPNVVWDVPQTWELTDYYDSTIPYVLLRDTNVSIRLRKLEDHATFTSLINNHWNDDYCICSTGFPMGPPSNGTCTSVNGVPAYELIYHYQNQGSPAELLTYYLIHQGRGYSVSFLGVKNPSNDGVTIIGPVADRVIKSLKFVGSEPSPSGSPSPSPSATPVPTPASTPLPGVSPTPSPSPSPTYNCS